MKMNVIRLDLPLKHPFKIAREEISSQSSVIVELQHEGVRGYGEVTENSFYGHDFDSISNSLNGISAEALNQYAIKSPIELWDLMHQQVDGDMFALSALDMAAHDLRGNRLGIPTWKDWGLAWSHATESSFTIGIDTVPQMVKKLQEEPGWRTYKIKLGTSHDLEIVKELRKHTDAIFRVDANCGWTAEQTISNSKELANLGVEFIEQPLPIDSSQDDKLRVFHDSAVPIIADEDCQVSADVEKCSTMYHGVNVKICKCGGLTPALAMLANAKSLGLTTMVGCMVESSIGISGAAQLLPLLDYADLDGAVLLRDEPCMGASIVKGIITLSRPTGCGSSIDLNRLQEFSSMDLERIG